MRIYLYPIQPYARQKYDRALNKDPPETACWAMKLAVSPPTTLGWGEWHVHGSPRREHPWFDAFVPKSFLHGFSQLSELTLLFESLHIDGWNNALICPELLLIPTLWKLTVKGVEVIIKEPWNCPKKTSLITDLIWDQLQAIKYSKHNSDSTSEDGAAYVGAYPVLTSFAALKSLRTFFYNYGDLTFYSALMTQRDRLEILDIREDINMYHELVRPLPPLQGFPKLRDVTLTDLVLWGQDKNRDHFGFHTAPLGFSANHLFLTLPQSLETMKHLVYAAESMDDSVIDTPTHLGLY